ncbi:MAG: type III pantothenate kinase [Candidatus Omnitrophica bacterium]|nr:type III pantothenate kinase [Candidatus Omnitrophota bacterium]
MTTEKNKFRKHSLAVDIGNSTLSFGLFSAGSLRRQWHIPQEQAAGQKQLQRLLSAHVCAIQAQVCAVTICSVAPKAEKLVMAVCRRLFAGVPVNRFGIEIPVPLKNNYRPPESLGKDRLANAVAAKFLYALPAIIIDAGTALTIDAVSAQGEFIGGIIFPGMETCARALTERAALLPRVAVRSVARVTGRSTAQGIASGIGNGFVFLVDGLVGALLKELRLTRATVIATGGHARFLQRRSQTIQIFNNNLTLQGIEKTRLATMKLARAKARGI